MAHDDDILYFQVLDRVFDGRVLAQCPAFRHIGMDEVGHVAQDEKVAGAAVGEQGGIDAGIAARDDQRQRVLPALQFLEQRLVRVIPAMLETAEAGRKADDERMLGTVGPVGRQDAQ